MKKAKVTEHQIEAEFVKWVRAMDKTHPEFGLFIKSPGNLWTTYQQMAKMKAEGFEKGYPDQLCPCPSSDRTYNGLAIEFKTETGKLSEEQAVWLSKLTIFCRFSCHICRSAEEAKRITLDYFGLYGYDEREALRAGGVVRGKNDGSVQGSVKKHKPSRRSL